MVLRLRSRLLLILASVLVLAACASAPPAPPPKVDNLWRDELFGAKPREVNGEDLFAVSDEMRRYVRQDMADLIRRRGPVHGLLDALYDKSKLKLEYDATQTRTAAGTFAARQGNCLSLVIMTGALARELGVEVHYQQVVTDTEWRRQNDLLVTAGHVNLRLNKALPGEPSRILGRNSSALIVDFLPGTELGRQFVTDIDERTVAAMFMNNRSAEALARGELNSAYWWAREAIAQDARFTPSYNTLAVVYQRSGLTLEAIRLLDQALLGSPQDAVALANQAGFLRGVGRQADAERIEARLKAIEPNPPYFYFNRGLVAMQAANYQEAREQFAKDLARQPYNPDFLFGMAASYLGEGDLPPAQEYLIKAREYGATQASRALYGAKIEKIEQRLKQLRCRRLSCDQSG